MIAFFSFLGRVHKFNSGNKNVFAGARVSCVCVYVCVSYNSYKLFIIHYFNDYLSKVYMPVLYILYIGMSVNSTLTTRQYCVIKTRVRKSSENIILISKL